MSELVNELITEEMENEVKDTLTRLLKKVPSEEHKLLYTPITKPVNGKFWVKHNKTRKLMLVDESFFKPVE